MSIGALVKRQRQAQLSSGGSEQEGSCSGGLYQEHDPFVGFEVIEGSKAAKDWKTKRPPDRDLIAFVLAGCWAWQAQASVGRRCGSGVNHLPHPADKPPTKGLTIHCKGRDLVRFYRCLS